MNTSFAVRRQWIMICIFLIALSSCLGKSPPSRFYALTPLADEQSVGQSGSAEAQVAIGIGPLTLADYLNQRKIVTRIGNNKILQAEFDLWAGSLKDNIRHVILENIGRLLPTKRLFTYPWSRLMPVDYQVVLDVVQCDGQLGEQAQVVVRWQIFDGAKKLLDAGRFSRNEPVSDNSYEALVEAQSRAFKALSVELATILRQMTHTGMPKG